MSRLFGILSFCMYASRVSSSLNSAENGRSQMGEKIGETDRRASESGTSYYQRYPSYPSYCSSPPEMFSRAIPVLNLEGSGLEEIEDVSVDILQVNTIIRHGQRTPYASDIPCWDTYNDPDADTSKWDCELTSFMSPPRYNSDEKYMLFEKRYDALSPPLTNSLGGTCLLGQLLVPGYDQELMNGRILRDAYFGNAEDGDVYGGMNLFVDNDPDHAVKKPYSSPYTVYRSDDEQRTLMSGQVLLRGLFEKDIVDFDAIIQLHTADYKNDVLTCNPTLCPSLTKLRYEALQSEEFQKFNTSAEAKELRRISKDELGNENIDYMLDCLMTTICTDRKLPGPLNDYGMNEDGKKGIFERLVDFSSLSSSFYYTYNDGAFSKLGIGPLWKEILDKIHPIRSMDAVESQEYFKTMREQKIPRLALYSGHDTTILPLLASLGLYDGIWPPYASMLIIEIYAIDQVNPMGPLAFRLLYNGEVLTDKLEKCPNGSELCSLSILFKIVGPFATNDRPKCAVDIQAKNLIGSLVSQAFFLDKDEKLIVLLIGAISAFIGWFITYVALMRRIPFKGKVKANRGREVQTYGVI